VTGLRPAKRREKVPIRVNRYDGRTLVVPADAHALLATGRVDERLFDVAELAKANRKNGLGLIVPVLPHPARPDSNPPLNEESA
jgi:hypothetical protein